MRYRLLLPGVMTLGSLGLAACAEEATQPGRAEYQLAAPRPAVASNTWLTRRDMPLDLLSQAAAVVPDSQGQSILYVIGGFKADRYNGFVPMGEMRAYSVATNTWTHRPDMPAARYGMNGAGVIDGKIYTTGGFTSRGRPTASLFLYDPASNTWSQKRDMPAAGGGGVTGVIGGKLYVVTFSPGLPSGMANFFRYDPATDSWTRLPRPTNYYSLGGGGGVIGGKLYLIAPRVLMYDPAVNTWTTRGPLPGDLTGAPVVLLGHLHLFGADTRTGLPVPGIFIYNPVSDNWETKPLLTKFTHWDGAELTATRVFVNGRPRVEVVGGARPGNNLQYIP